MEKLLTRWGKTLNKSLPLNDYPRPQMSRDSFINLNGIWNYAILDKNAHLDKYQGEIVVPFSPECILSGVEKLVKPTDYLYYQRKFNFVKKSDRVLLHFGAVDYACEVAINGRTVGTHQGGYFPFSFDITNAIQDGENEITVKVEDPSDTGFQARGKQSSKRGGIWYTPQSGIWQTVWLEEVCENYITSIKITPNIDTNSVHFKLFFRDKDVDATIKIYDNGIEKWTGKTNKSTTIKLDKYLKWSPENPHLYDVEITTDSDKVTTYFGMRKFSRGLDEKGVSRLMLNNKPYFQNGLLDQGYWSDGMYTPPSDEAMVYDIKIMKEMGFNMLRKHIKIEPLRWYYHCDKLGMLVWQDMINGGGIYSPNTIAVRPALSLVTLNKKMGWMSDGAENYAKFSRSDASGREEYYVDSKRLIDTLYNTVSLCLWVPFNEAWGQFDSLKACEYYRKKDPTRLIDHASGWFDQGDGDLNSFHIYFTRYKFPKFNKNDIRPIAVTEFGGFSLQAKGHMYNKEKFFGYRKFYDREVFENAIEKLYEKKIIANIGKGLSAAVYTEVSDVEDECNGLLTYDREVIKMDIERMKKINARVKI
ncbi:MAG TPA: glycoside hydrolase family 2 TIM barrel-domain containing protein [Clostridia bacterium]|nr:glycoside hydrolase family 2 TIM barrel-domain containing protein [Clostridia bacterium]